MLSIGQCRPNVITLSGFCTVRPWLHPPASGSINLVLKKDFKLLDRITKDNQLLCTY
jgi:hypothetical protein